MGNIRDIPLRKTLSSSAANGSRLQNLQKVPWRHTPMAEAEEEVLLRSRSSRPAKAGDRTDAQTQMFSAYRTESGFCVMVSVQAVSLMRRYKLSL